MAKKRYYIAYAHNLNPKQMAFKCPTARVIGTAVLKDYDLVFTGTQIDTRLTIRPKKGSKVTAAVWEMTEEDEKALDRYEGYPGDFFKKEMTIDVTVLRSGKTRPQKVFVYMMPEDRQIGIPSPCYVYNRLIEYEAYGFDESLIYAALTKSTNAWLPKQMIRRKKKKL